MLENLGQVLPVAAQKYGNKIALVMGARSFSFNALMVAVGSQPDELKGEVAKAYVVLRHGAQADEAGILALCREHLAAYKIPRAVQFVDDLPRTSTGKIMRRMLRTLDT